jgi:hypothetical protein
MLFQGYIEVLDVFYLGRRRRLEWAQKPKFFRFGNLEFRSLRPPGFLRQRIDVPGWLQGERNAEFPRAGARSKFEFTAGCEVISAPEAEKIATKLPWSSGKRDFLGSGGKNAQSGDEDG